jgi:predicted  nucleic acid-binding Zn-ribbon protein
MTLEEELAEALAENKRLTVFIEKLDSHRIAALNERDKLRGELENKNGELETMRKRYRDAQNRVDDLEIQLNGRITV